MSNWNSTGFFLSFFCFVFFCFLWIFIKYMASAFRASDWTQSAHTNSPLPPLPGCLLLWKFRCAVLCSQSHRKWNAEFHKYSQGVCVQVLIVSLWELLPQGARDQCDLDFPDKVNEPKQIGTLCMAQASHSRWGHEVCMPQIEVLATHQSSLGARL